jgi:hypothetical protein
MHEEQKTYLGPVSLLEEEKRVVENWLPKVSVEDEKLFAAYNKDIKKRLLFLNLESKYPFIFDITHAVEMFTRKIKGEFR